MKLIDLYLDEIRQWLPPRNREDILREIRSTLLDTLEDRNPGQTPDEDAILALLRDFGSPRQVAQQYGAQIYLIGPRLYSTYLNVLKIVLIVIAALNLAGLIIAILTGSGFESGAFTAIVDLFGGLISSLFTAFGVVTLSFAVVERAIPENWKVEIGKTWQPEDLLGKENKDRVKIAELAVEITVSLAFIVFINFFLDLFGIYYLTGGGWARAPILTDAFARYIPWITAQVILSTLIDLYLIRQGYWDKPATLAKLGLNLYQIAIAVALILGPTLISVDAAAWQRLNLDLPFTLQSLNRTLNTIFDILLGLSIFGLLIDSAKRIYSQFIRGTKATLEINT